MTHPEKRAGSHPGPDAWIACAGLVVLTWCWLEHRAVSAGEASYRAAVLQTEQMEADAARIASLQAAPRLASDRVRPNDELISQIEQAMTAAGISSHNWVGNEPIAPVRLAKSPYKRLAVRLGLEEVTLRQLIQFAHGLVDGDSALSIPHVRMTSPPDRGPEENWNVDLTVSYLVYSP